MTNKPNYFDPSTWSDELVLMELRMAQDGWNEIMFLDKKDRLMHYTPERELHMLEFWRSRLDLAEPEAKKRGLIK